MRKILAFSLVLGLAALAGGLADAATTDDAVLVKASDTGAKYEWSGFDGALSLVAEPGTPFEAYDCFGQLVAAGALETSEATVPAGNSGPGRDGVVLHVAVGDDTYTFTDPDWSW